MQRREQTLSKTTNGVSRDADAIAGKWYLRRYNGGQHMPTLRKVPADVAAAWDQPRASGSRVADDRYTWVDRPALLYISGRPRSLSDVPRVGDVMRLHAPANTPLEQITGVVLQTRVRKDGIWTHVELGMNGSAQWVSKRTISEHLGRIKGISRIDQPTKMINDRVHGGTHGWFVRVYDGKKPRVARSFSDRAAGGRMSALKAALAFHAASADLDPEEGIPFP